MKGNEDFIKNDLHRADMIEYTKVKDNEKQRLDILVSTQKSFSREYAKEVIVGGAVSVDGRIVQKPGEKVPAEAVIKVSAEPMKYVSRGGYKLEKALSVFSVHLDGKRCLDVGASTGGFTHCMLQHGAELVYAVDVGSGQLSEFLSADSRVVSIENKKIQEINPCGQPKFDFISVDVSFVSLTKIIPYIPPFLYEKQGQVVLLVKPQFEAGRAFVGKNGIVKNLDIHRKVILSIYECMKAYNLNPLGVTCSPIKGRDGNSEYLIFGDGSVEPINEVQFVSIVSDLTRFNKRVER